MAANYVQASALTRRAAYAMTPGYAALDLPVYEDWYLFISMLAAGWSASYTRDTRLFYRQHGGSRNSTGGADQERAIRRIMEDHPTLYRPWPKLWYDLHRTLFRRFPRVYVGLLMLACAWPSRTGKYIVESGR
jgi:hypothetical protein